MSGPGPVAALLLQQEQDFRTGRRLPVEEYLRRNPALAADPGARLKLVIHEVLLRQQNKEEPQLEEYQRLYPDLAPRLPRYFDLIPAFADLPPIPELESDRPTLTRPPPSHHSGPPEAQSTRLAAPAAEPRVVRPAPPLRVEGYSVLTELGRGGWGVVYKARHSQLGRTVALKTLLRGDSVSLEERARFLDEARKAAGFSHPNLVTVYEVGTAEDGRPYFTMELVEGGSLHDVLDGKPRPAADAARLAETLARALHHAHGRGLIHRDLKPVNVLLAADGTPKVGDFGLARRVEDDGRSQTLVVGTPSYMAPEQLSGNARDLGWFTDVYGLGAILYEMLTGRPPFVGPSVKVTLWQVAESDPVPPRALQPDVPPDLDTICLKCLEKDPRRRYPTAEALADDLCRFLKGEPIQARPIRWWGRAAKYARRHPARAALIAVSTAAAALLLATAGVYVYWQEVANDLRHAVAGWQQRADEERGRADQETSRANEAGQRADSAHQRADSAEQRRDTAEKSATEWERRETDARKTTRRAEAVAKTIQAWNEYEKNNVGWAVGLLNAVPPPAGDENLRGFEWRYLWRLCHADRATLDHKEEVKDVALGADGKVAVSLSPTSGKVLRWDVAAKTARELFRAPLPRSVALAPGGRTLAVGTGGGQLLLGDLDKLGKANEHGKLEGPALPASLPRDPKKDGTIVQVALDRDGKVLAVVTSFKTAELWDVAARERLGTTPPLPSALSAVALAPDGAVVAVGAHDGSVTLWDARARAKLPDGPGATTLAALGDDGPWAATLAALRTAKAHAGPVTALAFAPVEKLLATAGRDGAVRLWEAGAGRRPELGGHRRPVNSLHFSGDGWTLASAADDGTVALWDVAKGERRSTLRGHTAPVLSVRFAPSGATLASAGKDGTVKVWDGGRDPERTLLPALGGAVHSVALDGDVLLTAGDTMLRAWDLGGARPKAWGEEQPGSGAALSPGGRNLAFVDRGYAVRLREVVTGKEVGPAQARAGRSPRLGFAEGGRALVLMSGTGIQSWDPAEGGPPLLLGESGAKAVPKVIDFLGLATSTGATRVAVAEWREGGPNRPQGEYWVRVWDLRPEPHELRPINAGARVTALALSPDGRRIAWGRHDGKVTLADPATGAVLGALPSHLGTVSALAFTPDGTALATAGQEVALWDAATREARFSFPSAPHKVRSLAFSPDGRWLAAGTEGGAALLWEAAPAAGGGGK